MITQNREILGSKNVFVEVAPTNTKHRQVLMFLKKNPSTSREGILENCQISEGELDQMLSDPEFGIVLVDGDFIVLSAKERFDIIDGVLLYLNAGAGRSLSAQEILNNNNGILPDKF